MGKDSLGYDARRINYARLAERVISGVINVLVYGGAYLLGRALGLVP